MVIRNKWKLTKLEIIEKIVCEILNAMNNSGLDLGAWVGSSGMVPHFIPPQQKHFAWDTIVHLSNAAMKRSICLN